ncbi:MAG TPA: dihydrolipoamide acetyltransferase family protein [Polyangiaceae bacterium]|jgi:pyruvate dehydrogenase E2 component (dihydrolipoamide acetyltransferase)|nr:dihydrolipoamide acetyltransferase family protein [Polyangiaceae bacterium]
MARWEFKLPDVGEGVTEGEIVGWLVKPGDVVAEDQPIVEVMTDKATVTITAPKAGVVIETRGRVGEIVAVHGVLVVFELDAAHAPPPSRASSPEANGTKSQTTRASHAVSHADEGPAATAVGDLREVLPGMASASRTYFNDKPLATPATRKLAREMEVDLRQVPPTGPDGRVTRSDVEGFRAIPSASAAVHAPELTVAREPAPMPTRDVSPEPAPARDLPPTPDRIPFVGMRRRIAQKMAQSKSTAAHYTFVEECDATALKLLRDRLRAPAEARGVKLSFLPFIVKAVVAGLKKHPMLNTTLDEAANEIVFRKQFHIGVATATDAGLVVPVVRDADKKSILDIARDIERLAQDARTGRARSEDLSGSTFTVTSLGARGGLLATPIINFPEVAILGVHQMKTKPVVRDGQIVIGDVMMLSLSFDHRIVDGHVGAAFALEVIGYLEKPEALLLELT